MRSLSPAELLDVWERGRPLPSWRRALALLSFAEPDTPPEALETLSIGQRDAKLLTLREAIFGSRMECLAVCPACSERLELTLNAADLRAPIGDDVPTGPLELEAEGCALAVRAPDSRDLEAISKLPDPAEARRRLLERCIVSARREGRDVPADELSEAMTAAAAERIARAEAQADVQLDLTCPTCGHAWRALFDIVSFFWAEIQAWAHRAFREVHRLALAYGWSESEILAMTPARRRIYLEMLDG